MANGEVLLIGTRGARPASENIAKILAGETVHKMKVGMLESRASAEESTSRRATA